MPWLWALRDLEEAQVNAITQHIPDYVEGFERRTTAFDTLEELMAIDWVKQHSEPHEPIELVNVLTGEKAEPPKSPGLFHRFSQSEEWHDRWLLMAEFAEGKKWWVVGIMRGEVEGLPTWQHQTDG